LCIILVSQVVSAYCQSVSNVTSQQEGNKIKVNYQLAGVSMNQVAKVNLYYSVNNGSYSGPLQKVTGDAGDFVSGNGMKAIYWDVLSEVGSLEGNTTFKVEVIPQTQELYPKITANGFTYEIKSCKFKANQLVVDINITNLGDDISQWLRCGDDVKINDDSGIQYHCNSYVVSQVKVYDGSGRTIDFVKDIPIRISFVFNDVNTNSKKLSLLDFKFRKDWVSSELTSRLQIRDVIIVK